MDVTEAAPEHELNFRIRASARTRRAAISQSIRFRAARQPTSERETWWQWSGPAADR
ncbi:MAG TPA: hypothetical protein VMB81_12800 [Candidatus Sulfotelmatobacter sp.]|nr:hypothetical protein [Candidatus Sulfotelmatobacter sp.]